jgi:DNA-binding protein
MKINEIIKLKRKELDLTQEQMAEYLGVTTPAVNKWEKGNSYPDIIILPALARLLKVDLNTLLSFNDELTDQEIGKFTNDLVTIIDAKGYDEGFKIAMDKIYNYPNCYKLIYSVSSTLQGALFMYGVEDKDKYEKQIEKLFERVGKCNNPELCNHVNSLLISKYIQRKEYDSAQKLIDTLPNTSINKKQIQANLYIKQGKLSEASEILEQELLFMTNNIQTALLSMIDIALQESRYEDAIVYADKIQQTAEIYQLWDYNKYIGHYQIAIKTKDKQKSIDILKVMLPSIRKLWTISNSPLYKHIKSKDVDNKMGLIMLNSIIRELETSEEADFLKRDPKFIELLNEYKD